MSDNDTAPVPSPERPHEVEYNDLSSHANTSGEIDGDGDMSGAPCADLDEDVDTDMPPPDPGPRRNSDLRTTNHPSYIHVDSEDTIAIDQPRDRRIRGDSTGIREHDKRNHGDNILDHERQAFTNTQRNLPIRSHRPRNFDFGAPVLRDRDSRDNSGSGPVGGDSSISNNEPLQQPVKVRKKPGPPKSVIPPIKKNDIDAKKALIREIEGHWGKDFIKSYIPKIHRPLVKRKQGKPRSINRKVQDNPVQWMPSVLKAILMIAKICDDKEKLKTIMGDVVRYRNQHTGNKKPQLVTTDFDVIEDMLMKGWPVETSFNIRYKHLLQHRLDDRTDTQEKNDYYKHLFRDSDESDEGGDVEEKDEDDDEDDDATDANGGLSNDFQLQSGYYEPPEQRSKIHYDHKHKQASSLKDYGKNARHSQVDPYSYPPHISDQHGYGAGPPRFSPLMDSYTQPHSRHSKSTDYEVYGNTTHTPYDGIGDRGIKPKSQGRRRDESQDGYASNAALKQGRDRIGDSQQSRAGKAIYSRDDRTSFQGPNRRGRLSSGNMGPPRRSASPIEHRDHDRFPRRSVEKTPESSRTNIRNNQLQRQQMPTSTVIKVEPREDLSMLSTTQTPHGSRNDVATSASNLGDMDGDMDIDDPEYIRAQIEADEAQARAAKLRMRLIEIERKNQRLSSTPDTSGTSDNPVNLV